ncbi:MAG: hypothetical protein H7336_03070 [Bacteriovorax sp.]|nr:hypothetical protein [Bacteriovorax sp.]
MKKSLFAFCAFTMLSVSAFAGAPAPINMKCSSTDTNGKSEVQLITFEYGTGQKVLKLKNAKAVIVELSDNNEMVPNLYDIKLYLETSIVSAKGVSQSDNKVNGIHLVQIVEKDAFSIYCGI